MVQTRVIRVNDVFVPRNNSQEIQKDVHEAWFEIEQETNRTPCVRSMPVSFVIAGDVSGDSFLVLSGDHISDVEAVSLAWAHAQVHNIYVPDGIVYTY